MNYFDEKIKYENLNGRQKEIYNFQKVSALLADYGYTTIKLDDDWMGADFIAIHIDGKRYLKIQLKGRLTFDKKYIGKDIFICFRHDDQWFIYPHDILLKMFEIEIGNSSSWSEGGLYHFPKLTFQNLDRLAPYLVK
jgi:hypothetical protein